MLRSILISLLVSINLTADAQPAPKAQVNVAWELYKGCIVGTLSSSRPDRKAAVTKFVVDLDEYCLQWTVIWYSTQKDPIKLWPLDKHIRLNALREAAIVEIHKELSITALK